MSPTAVTRTPLQENFPVSPIRAFHRTKFCSRTCSSSGPLNHRYCQADMWTSGTVHLSVTSSPEKILESPNTISATALYGATGMTSGQTQNPISRSKTDSEDLPLFWRSEVIYRYIPSGSDSHESVESAENIETKTLDAYISNHGDLVKKKNLTQEENHRLHFSLLS